MSSKAKKSSPEVVTRVKAKKIKSKEEKESRKLFETIASELIEDAKEDIYDELESKCKELVLRSVSELRHEIFTIESSMSNRITQLETKINNLTTAISESKDETKKKFDNLQADISTNQQKMHDEVETERNKRILTYKKLQEKLDQHSQTVTTSFQTQKHDTTGALNTLNDDIRLSVKEVASLKEKVDEILMKQLGYMPRTGLGGQLYSAPPPPPQLDTNNVLDQIANKLNKLEVAVVHNNNNNNNNDDDYQASFLQSPSKTMGGQQSKSILNRIRKVEEQLYDLEGQVKENEIDIQQVKQTVNATSRAQFRQIRRDNSPPPEKIIQVVESVSGKGFSSQQAEELKEMERRIKKLADSTTKACRSLSTGLTDVQQAALNLYSWTDKVHDAFEVMAEKVDLPSNLCPRAKVSHSKTHHRQFPY